MKKEFSNFIFLFIFLFIFPVWSKQVYEMDTLSTSKGDLIIHFIGHGTLMFEFQEKTIHVDPFSRVADYTQLPKADIILITHHHGDHLDLEAINLILKKRLVLN